MENSTSSLETCSDENQVTSYECETCDRLYDHQLMQCYDCNITICPACQIFAWEKFYCPKCAWYCPRCNDGVPDGYGGLDRYCQTCTEKLLELIIEHLPEESEVRIYGIEVGDTITIIKPLPDEDWVKKMVENLDLSFKTE